MMFKDVKADFSRHGDLKEKRQDSFLSSYSFLTCTLSSVRFTL